MSDIVQKLWGFCHTLRHDGVDYGDYIEQITYLLFLKMADERGVEHPVFYASKALSPAQRNYSAVQKEALAIVHAVKKLRHYLLGRRFILLENRSECRSCPGRPEWLGNQGSIRTSARL